MVEYLEKYPSLDNIIKAVGVVVALYLFLRIMFFNTFIVDDHSGPIESLKQSFQLTKGYLLKVLVILAIILLFIGLPAKSFAILSVDFYCDYVHLPFCEYHPCGYLSQT